MSPQHTASSWTAHSAAFCPPSDAPPQLQLAGALHALVHGSLLLDLVKLDCHLAIILGLVGGAAPTVKELLTGAAEDAQVGPVPLLCWFAAAAKAEEGLRSPDRASTNILLALVLAGSDVSVADLGLDGLV
jgi:hypothetical protein